MVTRIKPRIAAVGYSTKFRDFLSASTQFIQDKCAERRHYRVSFETGMRIVRVYNWPEDVPENLDVTSYIGKGCPLYGCPAVWGSICSRPLLLPCPGDYELRLTDNALLPPEAVIIDTEVTAETCQCLQGLAQVHI